MSELNTEAIAVPSSRLDAAQLLLFRGSLLGLALLWLVFVGIEVGKSVFFGGSLEGAAYVFLYGIYLYLPWFIFSVFAFYLAQFMLTKPMSAYLVAVTILPFALSVMLFHVLLLTASYWLFWPQVVERVTFAFVFVEQLLKWALIELLAFYGIVYFWRHQLSAADLHKNGDSPPVRLCVSDGESLHNLLAEEIEYLLADDNHVIVNTIDGQIRVRGTLKKFMASLKTSDFLQTHRSAVVNIGHVKRVLSNRLVMESGHKVPVSRRRHKAVNDACFARSSK